MWVIAVLSTTLAANPYLEEARKLVDSMQYQKARERLEYARQATTSTREERRETYQLLARTWAAEGDLARTEAAFSELLAGDPTAPAPQQAPPRIRDAFRRAKERLYPPDFVALESRPAPAGRVELALKDPWSRVRSVTLQQARGDDAFEASPLPLNDEAIGGTALAAPAPGVPTRWFAEARGEKDEVLARLGSAEQPFVLEVQGRAVVEGEAPAAVTPRPAWVPWAVAAVGVAAAAAATTFVVLGYEDYRRADRAFYGDDRTRFDAQAYAWWRAAWGTGIGAGVFVLTSVVLFWVW